MIHVPIEEALRYLGSGSVSGDDSGLRAAVMEMAAVLEARLKPRWTFRIFNMKMADDAFMIPEGGITLTGKLASKMLKECGKAAILVCTLGAGFESLLRLWQTRDMAKAVILDACGNAYVEAGCDAAETEIKAAAEGLYLTDRFSPGYGDLPLSLQSPLVAAVSAEKRLGVEVTGSDLLIPSKTVTAVIGLSDKPQMARIRGCAYCSMRNTCSLRRKGASCSV